ncbi:MAG: hypothetical protein ABW022_16735 [Actinoplanes sp.]
MKASESSIAAAAITAAAVLALAMILYVTVGLAEALVLVAIVAVLSGMYALRRYARAVLVYRRPSDRRG